MKKCKFLIIFDMFCVLFVRVAGGITEFLCLLMKVFGRVEGIRRRRRRRGIDGRVEGSYYTFFFFFRTFVLFLNVY